MSARPILALVGLALLASCTDGSRSNAAVRFSEATPVALPCASGPCVLDLWLEGESKLQVASAGTGDVQVDIEFEDGDRQKLDAWTLVSEFAVRPLALPGTGARAARLHFRAPRYVRWGPARLLTPAPEAHPPARPPLFGACRGHSVLLLVHRAGSADGARSLDARLAELGVRFERCYAAASWSLPSTVSLWTSVEQERHGVVDADRAPVPERDALPARFASAGYRTVALIQDEALEPELGTALGFADARAFPSGEVAADRLIAAAELELEAGDGKPLFLHVQLDGSADGLAERFLDRARELRGGELVIVATAAHGPGPDSDELSEARLRVPLAIAAPTSRWPRGDAVEGPVSLLDVGPTLLELCGLPPLDGAGRSLTDRLGARAAERPARRLFVSGDYRGPRFSQGVVLEGYKYVRSTEGDGVRERLFDVEHDPDETDDLAATKAVRAGALETVLTSWWRTTAVGRELGGAGD